MAWKNPDAERRFQETIQAVFGTRCAEFSPILREKLRELYRAAHLDGIVAVMGGNFPSLGPGQTVEHFGSLQAETFIQNEHLRSQGHMRKILQAGEQTFTPCVSVLVDAQTGEPLPRERPDSYDHKTFQQYSPYKVVQPPRAKKGAA
jgi:hypothetical protein